jgi:guanylate kinase
MDTDLKTRYNNLLREIPKIDCDIKVLYDKGKDPSGLEEQLEGKKEELAQLSREIYSDKANDAILLVVSAPSGAGKTTVCRKLLDMIPGLHFSVSFTTRLPRRGEVDGKDYYFISKEEFHNRIAAGKFAEWAENYGNMYGTSLEEIGRSLEQKRDVLLDIDPRGAHVIKTNYPNGVFVFILPPSLDILKQRLVGRGSERKDVINLRFEKAVDEIKEALWYDYVIFNDRIDNSVDILRSIYIAEKNARLRVEDKIQTLRRRR